MTDTGDLRAASVALTRVVELNAPTALAIRPGDDALYFAERDGRVVRVVDGAVAGGPVLDISSQTTSDSERGMLGLAFSADGDHLYVSFTNDAGDSQLDQYRMRDGVARLRSRRNLLLVTQPYSNHNGGNVVTGPDDMLYFGLGDGGGAGDPLGSGQDASTLLGALLRIDPTPAGGQPYTVPADNPYADGGGRGEVWAYGLRNPWRFSFDRATNDLWIGDVGQGAIEEIDRVPFDRAAASNFGWNVFEGTQRFSSGRAPGAIPPIFEYPHDGRCSVTGGYVYRGDAIPELRGSYVFGDFCDGVIRALTADGNTVTADRSLELTVPALVSFGEDADGELYALSLEGTVFKITGR
ncbi:MAG TPA: PQQ-dependent sugar dehydrogenase [Euzebyales bacterium]|nr:PQQ-dependent sugar dehydrogenase [Euzebyales bacterium]